MTTLVTVLGAGRASRFGADKLVQDCAGKPLGKWALDAALVLNLPVVWISGGVVPEFVGEACPVARNDRATDGMGTSVALAATLADRAGAERLLVLLADMPLVTPALLRQLLATTTPAAFRQKDGQSGVPALLPQVLYRDLQMLSGDRGAGALLRRLPSLTLLDCPEQQLIDVDTPAALDKAARLLMQA